MRGKYKNPDYMKEWRENNREKIVAQQKAYQIKHKNEINVYRKKRYKKNRMSISEYNKRYGSKRCSRKNRIASWCAS